MAKLRHIAIAVRDLEEAAKFYEEAFGLERVRQSDVAVMMSDGVVSLAILDIKKNNNAAIAMLRQSLRFDYLHQPITSCCNILAKIKNLLVEL